MNSPEFDPTRARWRELIDRHLLGEISDAESRELEAVLAAHHEAREDFRLRCNVDTALRQEAASQGSQVASEDPSNRLTWRWLSLRPLLAAAGIVMGIFCTSLVFAYVVPSREKIVTLLDESFESGLAPLVMGIPVEAGRWSGDYSEFVGEQ